MVFAMLSTPSAGCALAGLPHYFGLVGLNYYRHLHYAEFAFFGQAVSAYFRKIFGEK
jgi:hypothetical protein